MASDNDFWAENYWNTGFWAENYWAQYVEPTGLLGLTGDVSFAKLARGRAGIVDVVGGGILFGKKVRGRTVIR